MARDALDSLKLRELKYGPKTPQSERIRVAGALLNEGRTAEALDLYLIAGDREGVRRIRELAVREGRPHLLLALRRQGIEPSPKEWKGAAEAAFEAERWREAYRAFTMAEDEAGLARVKEKIPGYEIFKPQGK